MGQNTKKKHFETT